MLGDLVARIKTRFKFKATNLHSQYTDRENTKFNINNIKKLNHGNKCTLGSE